MKILTLSLLTLSLVTYADASCFDAGTFASGAADYAEQGLKKSNLSTVKKFAEEAMYKCIAYAILSTTVYGQQLVPRFKKEKFAEVRKAKLRLSSLKIEELTQILRGKSKWIKH